MISGNLQNQPFYKKYVEKEYPLPNTDFIHDCGFYCGNYPELTESDLETLKGCLSKYWLIILLCLSQTEGWDILTDTSKVLFLLENNGGESGIWTPDQRIMIPLL